MERGFDYVPGARIALVAVVSAAIVAFLPDAAMADKFSTILCNTRNLFKGQTGTAVATLAIIFLGVGAFFGKVSWGVALLVGAGIGALFGADELVSIISGSNDVCNTTATPAPVPAGVTL